MLRRAANAMMGELAIRLAQSDLRITDATILMLVEGRDDLTASNIGRVLDVQRANMVPILARLEERGLIDRKPLDGKSQAVVLTAQGGKVAARARDTVENFEGELLQRIPAEHRDHLLPALSALVE